MRRTVPERDRQTAEEVVQDARRRKQLELVLARAREQSPLEAGLAAEQEEQHPRARSDRGGKRAQGQVCEPVVQDVSPRRLEQLVTALEGLYDYETGLAPRLTFGPNRRVGAAGAYIVRIDPERKALITRAAIQHGLTISTRTPTRWRPNCWLTRG